MYRKKKNTKKKKTHTNTPRRRPPPPKEASRKLEKLLLSAINNWQAKNEDGDVEKAILFIKEIKVDSGSMLKRLLPAPQGRAHRIRKRSNHVTLVLGSNNIED